MKMMFYMPECLPGTPWLELFLELVEKHKQMGDECILIGCRGDLPICYLNQKHKLTNCYLCKGRFKAGLLWLESGFSVGYIGMLDQSEQSSISNIISTDFGSTENVRAFKIDGCDVGLAAISSVITTLREPCPDYREHRKLIHDNLTSAMMVHYSMKNLIALHRPDRIVLFNGRISTQRPALRVAQACNIDVLVMETVRDSQHYWLVLNTYTHNIDLYGRHIEDAWLNSELSEDEKLKIGLRWFEEQRKNSFAGENDLHLSDISNINLDLKECKIVTIFNSSEDEFAAVEESKNPHYSDQTEGLFKIIDDLLSVGGIKVILRVHPNLRGIVNTQTRAIENIKTQFRDDNFIVFDAESRINSYNLIECSDVIITFGSTIGLEAVSFNKPSVLMGRTAYEHLDCMVKPKNHGECIKFVVEHKKGLYEADLDNNYRELAKYGFFMATAGIRSEYRKPYGKLYSGAKNSMIKNGIETFMEPPMATRFVFWLYPKIKRLARWK